MAININESVVSLISNLDLQTMNQFEVLFYPTDYSFKSILNSAGDTIISKLYLQDITVPFGSVTTERFGEDLYISGFERVDEVTIKFIEDDLGAVRTWSDKWKESIFTNDYFYGLILKENQRATLRNCLISPLMSNGLPSPAIIKIEEMFFKKLGDLTFSQGATDPMTLDIVFGCKNTEMLTTADLIS